MLALAIHGLLQKTPLRNVRASRTVQPSRPGDPYFTFMLLSKPDWTSEEDYREVRRNLLYLHCKVLKLNYPNAEDIIGLATEPGWNSVRSKDVVYFDGREFSQADRDEAMKTAREWQIFERTLASKSTINEYPIPLATLPRLKGRHRNERCECGSGRKYKHCCGDS